VQAGIELQTVPACGGAVLLGPGSVRASLAVAEVTDSRKPTLVNSCSRSTPAIGTGASIPPPSAATQINTGRSRDVRVRALVGSPVQVNSANFWRVSVRLN
jgi:hypothetical protein